MRIKKTYYNALVNDNNLSEKARDDTFVPTTITSRDYKTWRAVLNLKTCFNCADNHGRVFDIKDSTVMLPPLHIHCRCTLEEVEAIAAGNATNNGIDGADFELKHNGHLPDYYISSFKLEELGWQIGDPPSKYAPNRMLGGDVYQNRDRRLPDKIGRIWYEADIIILSAEEIYTESFGQMMD